MSGSADVLVVGAGPVGLTMACELRRHGVGFRILERLTSPPQYAKAVGVQPRTLEVWEDMGMVRDALDASIQLRGQLAFVNGSEVGRITLAVPPEVPYSFMGVPQYETERILTDHLEGMGGVVERGIELVGLAQDDEAMTATLATARGQEEVRAAYIVGCDGAHSAVRHQLDLGFEGERFEEEYMLGDVEVGWSLPAGFVIRAMHVTDEEPDDLLVCVPLPGTGRYRMSAFVPPELSGSGTDHGFATDTATPRLEHIQQVLDRLAPERVRAKNLRWSSVFRISHRLVDRYSVGRAFLCGDAAHIHPPTGAQGMNTGIQDAYNLAWKLALAVEGVASDGLLESYDAERRPVGEEVVGRTVRHARAGFDADSEDPATIMSREAQLLVGYPDSPLVGEDGSFSSGPPPGARAPDARGFVRSGRNSALRLFELLRGTDHVLLLYADDAQTLANVADVAAAAREQARGRLRAYAISPPELDHGWLPVPVVNDADGQFREAYGVSDAAAYLVRPDGYVGYRQRPLDKGGVIAALSRVMG